jgi:hypothetical protein
MGSSPTTMEVKLTKSPQMEKLYIYKYIPILVNPATMGGELVHLLVGPICKHFLAEYEISNTSEPRVHPETTRRPNVYDPNPESCSTIHQSDKFGHFRQRVGETISPLLFPSVAKQISSSQIHHLACGTPTEMWQEKRPRCMGTPTIDRPENHKSI